MFKTLNVSMASEYKQHSLTHSLIDDNVADDGEHINSFCVYS